MQLGGRTALWGVGREGLQQWGRGEQGGREFGPISKGEGGIDGRGKRGAGRLEGRSRARWQDEEEKGTETGEERPMGTVLRERGQGAGWKDELG